MPEVILTPEEITPQRLTASLHREEALTNGEVMAVTHDTQEGNSAVLSTLAVTYSEGAAGRRPGRLFLKVTKPIEWAREAGEWEAEFYSFIRPHRENLPMIVRCYDAVYSPEDARAHFLLDDLSDTHYNTVTVEQARTGQSVPPEPHLEAMVDCIAHFHAYWWERPELGAGVAEDYHWFKSADAYASFVEKRRREFAQFEASVGDEVSADMLALYRQALDMLPTPWDAHYKERMSSRKALTLTHGDCYFAQFLCPIEPGRYPTYLVDYQSTGTFTPTADLVYMFATFWTPAQRHETDREHRMLKRYLARLQERGVQNYTWHDLTHDYRLSLLQLLFSTIWDQTNSSSQAYLLPKLRCVTAALQDWRILNFEF